MIENLKDRWALILGTSSGHGAGTALELARSGMNIFGVHLDLRATLPQAQSLAKAIQDQGQQAVFFNTNAAADAKRDKVLDAIRERLPQGEHVKLLMHSLAFGTLLPYVPPEQEGSVSRAQIEMTLDVMAHSLVYWVQGLYYRDLLGPGSKVFAMTSSGSHRVLPNYGPVGCAKAALEYHVKHLAVELSGRGIAVNAIQAGVTDTPALRRIPGHEEMLSFAQERNPGGRITTPDDVARTIALLTADDSPWVTGNVINIDGGEDLVTI